MTDPFVALVFFAIALLVFTGVAGIVEFLLERREHRRRRRAQLRRLYFYSGGH